MWPANEVCQSTGEGGGSHVTIIHDAVDITVLDSPGPSPSLPPDMGTQPCNNT